MEPNGGVSRGQFYKKLPFLVVLLILTLVLIPVGFYVFKTYFLKTPAPKPAEVSSEAAIKAEELPIALDILKNPLVYEWRGSVEGTLVAKDEDTITLEKDSKKIILPINPGPAGVKFYTKGLLLAGPTKEDLFLSIDKIPLGTKLRGEFWVFPSKKDQLFTGSFTVIEQ